MLLDSENEPSVESTMIVFGSVCVCQCVSLIDRITKVGSVHTQLGRESVGHFFS